MIVGLDLRCLPVDGSDGAGVAHAARQLCARLVNSETFHWIVYLPDGARPPWTAQELASIEKREHGSVTVVFLKDGSGASLRQALHKSPCDLLFVPGGSVAPGLPVQCVPWVHDVAIFKHPEWFPQSWWRRLFTTRMFLKGVEKSPVVFAVSEYGKQSLVALGIEENKIRVTGEGGDGVLADMEEEKLTFAKSSARRICREKFGLSRQFVLALGTLEPRKNFAMLIRAWKKTKDMDLVLAGRDGWRFNNVKREIGSLKAEERSRFHRLVNVSDELRRQLLLAASIATVPSLDEGFGLVALEAMQAGTPVMVANRGALPEVVGKAGLLLDPENEEAWTQSLNQSMSVDRPKVFNSVGLGAAVQAIKGAAGSSIVTAISNPSKVKELRAQAAKWSWDKAARVVIDGFKGL